MKRRWWWVLLPLFVGGILGIILSRSGFYNPTVYLRVDLSVLVQFCGAGLALLLAGWFFMQDLSETRRLNARRATEAKAAEDHRRFLQRLDHELKNPLAACVGYLSHPPGFLIVKQAEVVTIMGYHAALSQSSFKLGTA